MYRSVYVLNTRFFTAATVLPNIPERIQRLRMWVVTDNRNMQTRHMVPAVKAARDKLLAEETWPFTDLSLRGLKTASDTEPT